MVPLEEEGAVYEKKPLGWGVLMPRMRSIQWRRMSPHYPKQERGPGLVRGRHLLTGRAVVSVEAVSQIGWSPSRQLVWRRVCGSRYSYAAQSLSRNHNNNDEHLWSAFNVPGTT